MCVVDRRHHVVGTIRGGLVCTSMNKERCGCTVYTRPLIVSEVLVALWRVEMWGKSTLTLIDNLKSLWEVM